jgi:hypothetical protein
LLLLQPNGEIDPGFSPQLPKESHVLALAVTTDGILVAGAEYKVSNQDFYPLLVKLDLSGRLIHDYRGAYNGIRELARALAVLPDSRFLGGAQTANFQLRLFDPEGRIDPAFEERVGTIGYVNVLSLESDRRLLVGGSYLSFGGISRAGNGIVYAIRSTTNQGWLVQEASPPRQVRSAGTSPD